MALPEWPAGLPYASLRDNYEIAESGQAPIASEMQSGRVRQRPRSHFRIAKVAVGLWLEPVQLASFRSFTQKDLGQGTSRFRMPVYDATTGTFPVRTVMIVNGLNGIQEKDQVTRTIVTFTLLVEMFGLVRPSWVGGAGLALDFLSDLYYSDALGLIPGAAAAQAAGLVSISRASSGYAQTQSGNWQSFAPNTLRRTDKGLLVEAASTNEVRNNSMQGAVAGSPGTLPSIWSISTSGIVVSVAQIITVGGIECIDLDVEITGPGAVATLRFNGTATVVAASSGQTWALSSWLCIISGGAILSQADLTVSARNASGGNIQNTPTTFLGIDGLSRKQAVTTMPIGTVYCAEGVSITGSAAGTVRLRLGSPQLERGAIASSPIRTTGAAATRAADAVSMTLPPGTAKAIDTFDDGSTQQVPASPGPYVIPTNLNRPWITKMTAPDR